MIVVPTAPWAHLVFDGLAWASGSAVGATLYRWRLRGAVRSVAGRVGPGYFAALALGAATGAWCAGSFNTLRDPAPELSHSIAGALVGAIIAVELYKRVARISGSTGGIFVGSLATGIVIGRWGCLFAGLPDRTYGTPTGLPWGVDLGDGIARHPVQIYESAAMAAFLALYIVGLSRYWTWTARRGFYALCVWYGAQRFAWEFLKPYPTLIGPFNVFHILSLGLVTYGCAYALRDIRAARADDHAVAAQGRALLVPGPDHQPV